MTEINKKCRRKEKGSDKIETKKKSAGLHANFGWFPV